MTARAAILLLATAAACAASEEASLVVGPGWLFARQRVTVDFTNTTQEVPFDFVPPQADEASLLVMPVSSPVELLAWRRDAAGTLVATLQTDWPRTRNFDAAFIVRGPDWRASYQLVVRADADREEAPVSMDLQGRIAVRNASGGAWSNAALRLVGRDANPLTNTTDAGFLEIDDSSPLGDIWRKSFARDHTMFAYDFERPVKLNAGEERAFTFVDVERCTAERWFVLKADDASLDVPDAGRPLRRFIVLKNDAAHGLGRDLPAGTAQIFLGSVRATLGGRAWFSRTPAGDDIRIELALSRRVRALRRTAGQETGTPGQIVQHFEIEIQNNLESMARVEVEERPPAQLDWSLLRSSQSCEVRNRRLIYRLDVPARDKLVIRYSIQSPVAQL